MSLITDLTGEIRSAKAPERSRGHTAPSTAGVAQAPAVTQNTPAPAPGSQADFPVEGAGGPARRDQANHYGWKLQAGMEIRSYAETIAVRDIGVSGAVQLDPAVATVWRISASSNFAINVKPLPQTNVGGTPASRVVSLVLYVSRTAGVAITWPAGTLFGSDVLDPDGNGNRSDSLLNPPLVGGRQDVYVLTLVPGVGWVGTLAAYDLRAV